MNRHFVGDLLPLFLGDKKNDKPNEVWPKPVPGKPGFFQHKDGKLEYIPTYLEEEPTTVPNITDPWDYFKNVPAYGHKINFNKEIKGFIIGGNGVEKAFSDFNRSIDWKHFPITREASSETDYILEGYNIGNYMVYKIAECNSTIPPLYVRFDSKLSSTTVEELVDLSDSYSIEVGGKPAIEFNSEYFAQSISSVWNKYKEYYNTKNIDKETNFIFTKYNFESSLIYSINNRFYPAIPPLYVKVNYYKDLSSLQKTSLKDLMTLSEYYSNKIDSKKGTKVVMKHCRTELVSIWKEYYNFYTKK